MKLAKIHYSFLVAVVALCLQSEAFTKTAMNLTSLNVANEDLLRTKNATASLVAKFTVALILVALTAFQYHCRARSRLKKHAAPEVSSWWNWHPVGYGVEFGTNWRAFLAKYTGQCGQVFRCRVGLESITFVNDHRVLTKMAQRSEIFRFDLAFLGKAEHLFHFSAPPAIHQECHHHIVKELTGAKLDTLASRFVNFFHDIMAKSYSPSHNTWQTLNAKEFVDHIVFGGASRAVIGNFDDHIVSQELKAHFDLFDDNLYLMAAGVPDFLLQKARASQRYVTSYLSQLPESEMSDFMKISFWLQDRIDIEIPHVLFLMLWAINANSQPSILWTLMFLLRDPDALHELTEEVQSAAMEDEGWTLENSGGSLPRLAPGTLKKMKKVQSYVLDCIRAQSSYVALRRLSQDHLIELKTGERFQFYKGDLVMGCNHHHREDIFPDPQTPKVDRFLPGRPLFRDADGTPVGFPNLSFGMGRQMCPGKRFFLHEASAIVATLLLAYDVELEFPDSAVPPPNMSRVALGCMTMDPKYVKDDALAIRLRRKALVTP